MKEVPEDIRRAFRDGPTILRPNGTSRCRPSFQKFTDNAVSRPSTSMRMPTIDDVRPAYMLAYEMGCKG
jgi:ribonucleoside-diphosphate reductase alpha chain